MGGNSFFDGFDVYCNEVHLGKTPFLLTDKDFENRVKPRSTPPNQPHIHLFSSDEEQPDFSWAQWTWVPGDLFSQLGEWSPDHQRYHREDFDGLMEDCREARFWWRFERKSCQGVVTAGSLSGGGFGTWGGLTTVYVTPSVETRSAAAHAQVLVDLITAADFEIEEKVIQHILDFRGHLFPEFLKIIPTEPRLETIFQRAAEVDFEMPAKLTEAESKRILDRILSGIRQRGTFSVPSTAGTAVLREPRSLSSTGTDATLHRHTQSDARSRTAFDSREKSKTNPSGDDFGIRRRTP